MNEKVDDILQHYGIKGMKWGKRKSSESTKTSKSDSKYTMSDYKKDRKAINAKVKSKQITRKQALTEINNNVHKVNMNSPVYKKVYNQQIAKGKSERVARVRANRSRKMVNSIALNVAASTAAGAFTVGQHTVSAARSVSASPEAARVGKNIILAATRSNLRYPKPSDIKNVVN